MRRPGGRGFTLLEVAVALAILGVGIVSCLQIFAAALRLTDRATRETGAVREARTAMDALLALPPEDFSEHPPRGQERTTEEGLVTRVDTWREELPEEKDFAIQDPHRLYHLQVTVTWQDAQGTKSYMLETLRMLPEENGE
jgi:prepilin-type N-terminal cleavage/methylation domain-containing protein